jgi:hypothetical protein
MITLSIRYAIDPYKLKEFEEYARGIAEPIRRCGGELVGYYLPTKFAGKTDEALALIDFPSLAAYEEYRAALARDPRNVEHIARAEAARCILSEDRAFLARVRQD